MEEAYERAKKALDAATRRAERIGDTDTLLAIGNLWLAVWDRESHPNDSEPIRIGFHSEGTEDE